MAQLSDCCAIGLVHGFRDDVGEDDWSQYPKKLPRIPAVVFDTQEERFKDFLDRVEERLAKKAEEYGDVEAYYSYLTATLIKDYAEDEDGDGGVEYRGREQIPGFIDFLKANGWTEESEIRNPKTHNRISVLKRSLM